MTFTELLALIPALLLTGILFLATPSQDPRYIDSYHMLASFFILVAASSIMAQLSRQKSKVFIMN